ncbi:MAG: MarC family protein [Planctomycetota bacterium]|jgi:multiple antibiotic resistance protein
MPEQLIPFVLTVFAGFFAIMNPITNTPIFLGVTKGFDGAMKRRIAAKATITAFLIVLVLAFAGKLIFVNLFGLTLPALRITGGVVIFIVGLELLRGKVSKTEASADDGVTQQEAQLGLAISPMATPILAGPGTIVTAANFVAEGSFVQDVAVVGVFALMCAWTYGMFISGERLVRFLGKDAVDVIGRLMGLILATLGVHMLSIGIYGSVVEGIHFVTAQQ